MATTSPLICARVLIVFSCLLFMSRCSGATKEPSSPDDRRKSQPCLFGGKTHPQGHKFQPYPCTTCRCHRGHVTCAVEDCQEELNCLRHANETSPRAESCCSTCLEYGCRHTDGVLYRPGEVISQDDCSRCYCPQEGGQSTCDVTHSCPPTLCVDFEIRPGQCCPRCPRGSNCQHQLYIIARGDVLDIDDLSCRCRLKRRGSNFKLEAKCMPRSL